MKHQKMQAIALERIYRLFELAQKQTANPARGKRYILLALEIGKKARVKIPKELKTQFCKKCKTPLNPANSQIQKNAGITAVKCAGCGFERKIKSQ